MLARRAVVAAALAPTVAAAALPLAARAQEAWPARPVRWVVPFPPGGGVDTVSRLIAQRLTETQPKPFVVENIAGGSGVVGTQAVLRAEPDGYTLLMQTTSSAVINPAVMRNLPYDPVAAFAPVTLVATIPMLLVVHPAVPARTIGEFIALLKANPGKFNYGSSGPRTLPHLSAALFAAQAGVQIEHVAYRGTGPAAQALLSGEIPMLVDSVAAQRPYIQAGSVRPLAVLARARSPLLPEVPTLAESGLPDYAVNFWIALFGAAALPAAIAERQAALVRDAMRDPALAPRLADLGVEPVASSPAELGRIFRDELAATRAIVARTGIEME
jgi:tripartite-type tricarboxylate transporter receptor subunit TctC